MIAVPDNAEHLDTFQNLARENSKKADNDIQRYVLELQRLTAGHVKIGVAVENGSIGGQSFQPGDQLLANLVRYRPSTPPYSKAVIF